MTRTLLSGARVVTMAADQTDGDLLDVLVDGGRIVAVSAGLDGTGAEVVDVTGRVIIPGLVNAHLHTWQSALRGSGADWALLDYLVHTHGDVAERYTPEDMRIGTLFGALGQISSGTTTLGDWSHNLTSSAAVDAALDGLRATGIRAVFFDGSGYRDPGRHPLRDIDRIRDDLAQGDGLVTAGLAIKGPQYTSTDDALADLRAARERDLLVSMHHSGGTPGAAWHAAMDTDLLGPNTNVVHGGGLSDEWLTELASRGVSFTITPESELRLGPDAPILPQLTRRSLAPSIGTDVDAAVPGEVLTAARVLLAYQRSTQHARISDGEQPDVDVPLTTARQALSWATVEGARALGLAEQVGCIEVGLHADLVVIDTTAPNLWPAHDPIATALHAHPGNIEAVMIGGHWRKRHHQLVDIDLPALRSEVAASARRVTGPPGHI